MVLRKGYVIDAKICILKERSLKTVIALEKKTMYFITKTLLIKKKRPYLNEH